MHTFPFIVFVDVLYKHYTQYKSPEAETFSFNYLNDHSRRSVSSVRVNAVTVSRVISRRRVSRCVSNSRSSNYWSSVSCGYQSRLSFRVSFWRRSCSDQGEQAKENNNLKNVSYKLLSFLIMVNTYQLEHGEINGLSAQYLDSCDITDGIKSVIANLYTFGIAGCNQ